MANFPGIRIPPTSRALFRELKQAFLQNSSIKSTPEFYCSSPGRLNLIGEHIDYCGGNVMPAAISMGTFAVAASREDSKVKIRSLNFDREEVFELNQTEFASTDTWIKYPKGVFHLMQNHFPGRIRHGVEIFLKGNLPLASGLSSSASLLLCIVQIIKQTYNLKFSEDPYEDMRQTALFAQKVENEYIGLQCGIMDQGSIVFGKKDHLMLMDCAELRVEYLPFFSEKYALWIADTKKPRELAESKYNERKAESDEALRIIRSRFDVTQVCAIGADRRDAALELIQDLIIRKRARHLIDENLRVFQVKEALRAGDFKKLGNLLIAGHNSLKDDYEVTGKELDSMFNHAVRQNGVVGARMTGAGFAGSVLILAEKEKITDATWSKIAEGHEKETGYTPDFYPFEPSEGLKIATQPF